MRPVSVVEPGDLAVKGSLQHHPVLARLGVHGVDAGARIVLPDKLLPPSRFKLATKWMKRRLGLPMYHAK